jgi:hypothetical protein
MFVTEIFDLTNATSGVLTFDLAKAQYSSALFDGMRVEASIDCGATYTAIYDKTDLDLSTVSGYVTSNWSPASENDWRNEQIDLNAFFGENVMFKFVNINGYGNSTVTSFLDNYTYNAPNELDVFVTEIFDLTNATSAVLAFDLAKAQYSSSLFDGMRVEASIDCGTSYTVIYEKTDLDLSTVPSYVTGNWTPSSANDWRNEQIDLNPFFGEKVLFRFVNINGYGNSTFIDNINVAGVLGVVENELNKAISLYPNPAKSEVNITLNNQTFDSIKIQVFNSLGQTLKSIEVNNQNTNTFSIDVSNLVTGLYFVTIDLDGVKASKKLLVN